MQPLSGLRVVALADEKGELCGRLLADLGAEVIRVEPPDGALSRRLPPFAPDGETCLYFGYRNAGKRSRVIDLEALVEHSDNTLRPHEIRTIRLRAPASDAARVGRVQVRFVLWDPQHPAAVKAGLGPDDLDYVVHEITRALR